MGGNTESSSDMETPSESLGESMTRELQNLSFSFSSTICKVPKEQRNVEEEAYTPTVVSLGPLHHGRKGLRVREEHKKWYLNDFVQRTNVSIGSYIGVVWQKEKDLRACYAETIPFSREEFVKIILVDAVFIIHFLLGRFDPGFNIENEPIFSQRLRRKAEWDMLMLENQLPFFILEDLFHLAKETFRHYTGKWSYIFELSHKFVGAAVKMEASEEKLETMHSSGVAHFVDMERLFYIPLSQPQTGTLKTVHIKRNDFHFVSLCEALNTYSKDPWHDWMANLKQNYFNTPWAAISFIAGVILLTLTLIQTVCSVISLKSSNMDANRH